MLNPPCRQMLQHGTTRNISFMPFINGAVINIAIFCYGYLKDDFTVIVVNSIGSVIHIFYVLLYNVYSHQKEDTYKKTTIGFAVLFTLYMYLQLVVVEQEAIIETLGMFTLVLLMAGYIAPLLSLVDVVKKKSSHGIPLSFTAAMMITSVLWLLYGYAINDMYILVPSFTGMFTSLLQIVFVLLYPPKKLD
ncbi:sugar transporter SWEET1-like isoform X2 [Anneissia japonica]|uniref:sugar transporter SWEET1-like isoform X2 n=1 Tax=Anneissia japonica TaxID=1529436 RepID=UPI001425A39C|nr:sugar transporter SWEET1-like isoform X2 [Anneissia japonica]